MVYWYSRHSIADDKNAEIQSEQQFHDWLIAVPETGLEPARDRSRQPLKLACLPYPDVALVLMSCCKLTEKLGLRRVSRSMTWYSHIGRIANVFTKYLPILSESIADPRQKTTLTRLAWLTLYFHYDFDSQHAALRTFPFFHCH